MKHISNCILKLVCRYGYLLWVKYYILQYTWYKMKSLTCQILYFSITLFYIGSMLISFVVVPASSTTIKNLSHICNEEFLQNNETTIWRSEEVEDEHGKYTISKCGDHSKFVFFSIPPKTNLSFARAVGGK